jgi:uncharacterized protein (TIGR02246 family)
MRNTLWLAGLLVGCLTVGAAAAWKQAGIQPTSPATDRTADIKALQQRTAEFMAAYNKADAAAIASLFTADAEMVDDEDHVIQGRDNIRQALAQHFAGNKNLRIEVRISSRRFVSPDTVMEDGDAIVHYLDKKTVTRTTFMNVVVRREGRWQVASVRETEDHTVSAHDQLKALEWMLGQWVDEQPDSLVTADCRWSPDQNYILRDFTCRVEGKTISSGTMRIGWDAQTNRIKSWLFDSEGGHGEAYWVQDGNRWIVKATSVSADGTPGSATYVFTMVDANKVTLSVLDRVNGSSVEPDFEVTMVRKAPAPVIK